MSALSLALLLEKSTEIESLVHYACGDRNLLGMQMDLLGANALGLSSPSTTTRSPAFMRVTLEKVVTTPRERMTARTMSATLDPPDDALDAAWLYRARPATAQAAVVASAMAPLQDAQTV